MPQSDRRPDIVGIEITRTCNLRCPHCFTAASNSPVREMSTEELRSAVDQLIKLGPPRAIGWTGGEPLLRDDLDELMAYAYRHGKIRSGITTNGLLLDKARAQSLKDSGAYAVQISVDGSNAENFAAIRAARTEDFKVILKAMEAVKDVGLQLHLAMLLSKATLSDARSFLKFAADNDADGVRFCGFVPAGRGNRQSVRSQLAFDEDLSGLLEFVEFASLNRGMMIMFDPAFGPLPPDYSFHECVAGIQTMYISSTGSVYPCTSLISQRFEVGNFRDRSLAEIWNDPKMTEIANWNTAEIDDGCRNCNHLRDCHGGCRGIAFANSGSVTAAFPNCLYQFEMANAKSN